MRAINQIIVSTKQVQIDFKTCSIIVIRIDQNRFTFDWKVLKWEIGGKNFEIHAEDPIKKKWQSDQHEIIRISPPLCETRVFFLSFS